LDRKHKASDYETVARLDWWLHLSSFLARTRSAASEIYRGALIATASALLHMRKTKKRPAFRQYDAPAGRIIGPGHLSVKLISRQSNSPFGEFISVRDQNPPHAECLTLNALTSHLTNGKLSQASTLRHLLLQVLVNVQAHWAAKRKHTE
jgi:hypothetical protein